MQRLLPTFWILMICGTIQSEPGSGSRLGNLYKKNIWKSLCHQNRGFFAESRFWLFYRKIFEKLSDTASACLDNLMSLVKKYALLVGWGKNMMIYLKNANIRGKRWKKLGEKRTFSLYFGEKYHFERGGGKNINYSDNIHPWWTLLLNISLILCFNVNYLRSLLECFWSSLADPTPSPWILMGNVILLDVFPES